MMSEEENKEEKEKFLKNYSEVFTQYFSIEKMEKSIPETDQKNNQPQQTTQENVNQEPQNQNENPVNSINPPTNPQPNQPEKSEPKNINKDYYNEKNKSLDFKYGFSANPRIKYTSSVLNYNYSKCPDLEYNKLA